MGFLGGGIRKVLAGPTKSIARFRAGWAGAGEKTSKEVADILKHKTKAAQLRDTLTGQAKKIEALESQAAKVPSAKKWSVAKGAVIGAAAGTGALGAGLGIRNYREKSRKAAMADQLLAYHRMRQQ